MAEGIVLGVLLLLVGVQYFGVLVLYLDARKHGSRQGGMYAWTASYVPLIGIVIILGYLYDRDRILASDD